jgi:hypothetical protein
MPTAERVARNEDLFREVNERISDIAEGLGLNDPAKASFVCECSRTTCTGQIELTLEEYTWVRSDGKRFVCLSGHEDPERESVVAETDRFIVVEKNGTAGAVAEDLDPRT